MARFVDKQNLPQYKYFNNMVGRADEVSDLTSLYIAGDFQLTEKRVSNNSKEYRTSLLMLNKAKSQMAQFLYSSKEDQEKCKREITMNQTRLARQNGERYINLIMVLRFFQGDQMKHTEEADPKVLQRLSEKQKAQKYKYRKEDGKYLSSFFSIPKLVLINGELFNRYLERSIVETEKNRLNTLIPKDIHYIINVQSEEQKDTAYLVTKEEGKLYIEVLNRYHVCPKVCIDELESNAQELGSVALCLLDYLIEFGKMERKQKQQMKERSAPVPRYDADQPRPSKYIDQNSIKIFDLKPDQISADYFTKKYGNRGVRRRSGYEMAPHTRRGHYRKYRNGKTVYVRSSVIHKERYKGIGSAHRINQEALGVEDTEMGGQGFSMGMQM